MKLPEVTYIHVYPPVPRREWDWCAVLTKDKDEESAQLGWGETKESALEDLMNQDVYDYEILILNGLDPEKYMRSSYWECDKSPVENCVYDMKEDTQLDSCIYCGDPSERK